MRNPKIPMHLPKFGAIDDNGSRRPVKLHVGMDGTMFYGDVHIGLLFKDTPSGPVIHGNNEPEKQRFNGLPILPGTKEEYLEMLIQEFGHWEGDVI